ncbi:HET-domain-containing protein [Hypomontagnella monticulosa]|nr:HET-domain-containing protein [Hypomontagnella monticulosa]
MRLLNAKTKKVREFLGVEVPPYAILSHTWGANEVTFADIQGTWPSYRRRESWKKIEWCCREALEDDLEYVWVDTCCIDKSSSAELQEAINSMFQWYETSEVCYAYLEDVEPGEEPEAEGSSFSRSRWHSRGWTLQELIAPEQVIFFDSSWNPIGTRVTLRHTISLITGIDQFVLENIVINGRYPLRRTSIAQKMSWVARRSTTRPEDMAYCLLGIFGVHMPMLYGEGTNAFVRLQEEIMKSSHDQTVLAWGLERPVPTLWNTSRALASLPIDFAACSNLVSFGVARAGDSFAKTQRGLELHLPVKDFHGNYTISYCLLNCAIFSHDMGRTIRVLALPLLQISSLYRKLRGPNNSKPDEYARMPLNTPLWVPADSLDKWPRKTIYLRELQDQEQSAVQSRRVKITLQNINLPDKYFIVGIWPPAVAMNDLLEFKIERVTHEGYILLHIARKSGLGFILVIRHGKPLGRKPVLKPDALRWGGLKLVPIDYIKDVVRSAVCEVLKLVDEKLEGNTDLVVLGMDSPTKSKIASFIHESTGWPVYPDALNDSRYLWDIQRSIILLSRTGLISDDETSPWRDRKGITDAEFALVEAHSRTSLLDLGVDSADACDTWKFQSPSLVSKTQGGVHHYKANLVCGSQLMLKVSLKADVDRSKLSLRLISQAGEPDTP